MKRVCVSVLLAVPLVMCALRARADDADMALKEDLKKLEGTWVLKENSRVGEARCRASSPSEPCVRLSPHTAQAGH
jgi:hypothetical protein